MGRNVFSLIKDKFKKSEKKPKTKEEIEDEEDGDARETWGGQLDFFLSSLGYAVGLGNIWRFPYLCYKNGGGVFLIPYLICLIIFGIPLMLIEMAVGQYTSTGPLTSWTMVPMFKGLGIPINLANAYLTFFYNMLLAYGLYFLVLSFTTELPWQKCNPEWASPNCVDDFSPGKFSYSKCINETFEYKCSERNSPNFGQCFNLTTFNTSRLNTSQICNLRNNSFVQSIGFWKSSFPSQDYWQKVILRQSSTIDESGTMVWQLVLALLASWVLVYSIIVLGVKISGKVVYFTSVFPYVILTVLGIRGWMLPGADIGIKFYIFPDFSKLSNTGIWVDAASQTFFSLSLAYGGLSTLSSYNKFNANIYRDAILVPVCNFLTSVFAGFVIFAYMGYLSHITGQDISNIVQAGQGLAFVVYPFAVTTIAGAPFWSICFFFMVVLLAIDTAIASVETTITSCYDAFPFLTKTTLRKHIVKIAMCVFYFLGGLLYCIQSGTYWLELVNNYAGDWAILLIGALESISVAWFYGFNNFRIDLKLMLGDKLIMNWTYYVWYFLWAVGTPIFLVVLVAINFPNISKIKLEDYEFPDWTHIFGEIITVSILVGQAITFVWIIVDQIFFKKKTFLSLFKPDFENYHPLKTRNHLKVSIARGLVSQDNLPASDFKTNSSFKEDTENTDSTGTTSF